MDEGEGVGWVATGGTMVKPRTPVLLKWGIRGSDGGTHKKKHAAPPGEGGHESDARGGAPVKE